MSLAGGGEAKLDVLGGLKEAVVDPMWSDIKDAYWLQRAARERYPAADAVLNFVPYVGAVTNADDIVQDIRGADYKATPGDAAGMALNLAATKAGVRGLSEVARDAERLGRSGGRVMAIGVGMPATGYLTHYADRQKAAEKAYGDTPLLEIARQLRSK